MNEIYVAGGCFWGVEAFFKKVKGIEETACGYANSLKSDVTYEEVCSKEFEAIEVVKLKYDDTVISIEEIIDLLFLIIDPTSLDKQGEDEGIQYRTGMYYLNDEEQVINNKVDSLREKYSEPVHFEIKKLVNFYLAEEYHQKYLDKNINGYCHVNMGVLPDKYKK